jgi:hypothetical protein
MDIISGMDTAVTAGWKVAQLSATDLAARTGALTAIELEAVTNKMSSGIIYSEDHILELAIGRADGVGNNTIVLATSQSGKTTLLNGFIHLLLARPVKQVLIVADPNYGAANDSVPIRWAGLPRYKGANSPIAQSCLLTKSGDIRLAIMALGELYEQRMEQAQNSLDSDSEEALSFTPIYMVCDEFQTTLGQMTEEELEETNATVGKLIRAKKFKIFFAPILHDDTAKGSLDTNRTQGLNILLLGSIVDRLDKGREIANSRDKFRDYQSVASGHRSRMINQHGADAAKFMLGVIHLKDGFKCSDGTVFQPGPHCIKLPDYRDLRAVTHDFPALPSPDRQSTVSKAPPRPISRAVATAAASMPAAAEVLSVGPMLDWGPDGNPSAEIQKAFRNWVISNYSALAERDSWSRSGLLKQCQVDGLGTGRRGPENPVYVLVWALADAMGGQIIPSQLLAFIDGENP